MRAMSSDVETAFVEIGRVSCCLNAWREWTKVQRFNKVAVYAFRERALVRATRSALQGWREVAAETRARRRAAEASRRAERGSAECSGRCEEEEEEETSAFTLELEKLKMQAASNFFAIRFLRRSLVAWREAARDGPGSARRRERELEKERKQLITSKKFCRLMLLHRAFGSWQRTHKLRTRASRLGADKEYRALKMQQVLIRKKRELSKNKGPEKENVRPAVAVAKAAAPAAPAATEDGGRGRAGEINGGRPKKRGHSEGLELSLRRLASRRSETSQSSRLGAEGAKGKPSPGERGKSPARVRCAGGGAKIKAAPTNQAAACEERRREGEEDLRSRLEERAMKRTQRREDLRQRYERKVASESEESQQEKDQNRNYERRRRELQRIEAKERVYRLELQESERISKQELRSQQLFLAKMHRRRWLLARVGLRAFKDALACVRSKESSADSKYARHLSAVALQGWKLYTMPYWRRKVLYHVHLHGALHRFLARFRLDRAFGAWLSLTNAKKFKRHRIASHHFAFFKELVASREGQRALAARFHARRLMREHLRLWRNYASIRAELVLLHELEVAHAFRQEYQKGLARRAFEDWRVVAKDLRKERKIEAGKRQAWGKINQWLEELDKDKAKKREAEQRRGSDKASLLHFLSKRDYSVPFSFEERGAVGP